MKKIFKEYGGVIIAVIAIVALIGLVGFLMRPGGVLDGAFGNIVQSFTGKTNELVTSAGVNGSGGSGANDPALNHANTIPEGGTYTTAQGAVYTAGDPFPACKMNNDVYTYNGLTYTLKNRTGNEQGADTLEDARVLMKEVCQAQMGMSWSDFCAAQGMTEDQGWAMMGLTEDVFVPASGGEWTVATDNGNNVLSSINGLSTTVLQVIPAGGTYMAADGSVYNAGEGFPLSVSKGDIYKYGDYYYAYQDAKLDYSNTLTIEGWNVYTIDDLNKTSYGEILESINGEPVTAMVNTFKDSKIETTPAIPDSVTILFGTFENCSSLTTAPKLPNNTTILTNVYYNCNALKTYVGSTGSDGDFSGYLIPVGVTNMQNCFAFCASLATAPAIPSTVTIMQNTFQGCCSLTTAPVIPNSVTNIDSAFYGCTSLTGTITINATPTLYGRCLHGTSIMEILGDCTIKDVLLATK